MSARRRVGTVGCLLALACAATPVVAADGSGPVAVFQPYFLGVPGGMPTEGVVLKTDLGVWSGGGNEFRVTWQRCTPGTLMCTPIPGAAGPWYTPGHADVGLGLRAMVTASGPSGEGTALTAVSQAVAAAQQLGNDSQAHDPVVRSSTWDGVTRVIISPGRPHTVFGEQRTVSGQVLGTSSRGVGNTPVTLRDPSGELIATTFTSADGRFRVGGPARRPGTWWVAGEGWASQMRVDVRPRITLTAATRRVHPPGVVGLEGSIRPAVAGKLVQLQYFDPARGWRLWRQVATTAGGRFAVRRVLRPNPAVPRFVLRIRAGVPSDVGWPYAATASGIVSVHVG